MTDLATDAFNAAYADVAVRVGANVQSGQLCFVVAPAHHLSLARAVAEAAWRAGAGDVQLVFRDEYERYLLARFAAEEALARTPVAHRAVLEAMVEAEAASVHLLGDVPPFFAAADPERLARARPADGIELSQRAVDEYRLAWTVVAAPEPSWAERVFGEPDLTRLLEELGHACRLDNEDPVRTWHGDLDRLLTRAAALNAVEIDRLRIRGPATDLLLGLLPGSVWVTANRTTRWGQTHCSNLPTEEVYTTPDCRRADGTVAATRPVVVDGVLVEGMTLELEGGRIVRATATAGEQFLRAHIGSDAGAARLGEVALVAGSRTGSRNVLFYNPLLDENAASHIAYGSAYPRGVEGADELDREQQAELGINQSNVHVDFPVGGPGVEITAIGPDGTEVPLISGDDWLLDQGA